MIAALLPSAPAGHQPMGVVGARAGAIGQAAAFASLVVPNVTTAGALSIDTDDPAVAATGRQDDAGSGESLPAATADGGGDAGWLSALLGSTALVQQPAVQADPSTPKAAVPGVASTRAVGATTRAIAVATIIAEPAPIAVDAAAVLQSAREGLAPAVAAAGRGEPDALPRAQDRPAVALAQPVVEQAVADRAVPSSRPSSPNARVAAAWSDTPAAAVAGAGSPIPAATVADGDRGPVSGSATPPVVADLAAARASTASVPPASVQSDPVIVGGLTPNPTPPTAPVVATLLSSALPTGQAAATSIRSTDTGSSGDRSTSPVTVARAPLPFAAPAARPAPIDAAPPPPASPVATAGDVFAAAIHAAGQRDREGATSDDIASSMALAGTTPLAVAPAQAGAGADPSLDMRHGNWPGAMIDHIEKLRDAADAVDTRIRLVPDALGGIDVALRRHDDGVQVTLRADQPTTHAMLADARPQLTAMAEARGIRLVDAGPSSGGLGTGGDPSSAGNRQQSPAAPAAPASAFPAAHDQATPDPADGRVA